MIEIVMGNTPRTIKPKICFIALGAYPLIFGTEPGNVIGPDVHQVVLARELEKLGYGVSMITYGDSPSSREQESSIRVVTIPESVPSPKAMNKIFKIKSLSQAFFRSRSDIYYHTGGVPGIISILCKLTKKRFIYGIASDALVNRNIVTKKNNEFGKSRLNLNNIGNFFDIHLADSIFVQSRYQQEMLKKNFGKESIIIKMPFPIPDEKCRPKDTPPVVLWVGSMAEVKQPELYLEIVKKLPSVKFQIVGGYVGDSELYDKIKDRSSQLPNLNFVGPVPFDKIDSYFRDAAILANTSMFEGFPNSFVQAWISCVPVVSLNADPDEIICKNELGFHSKTVERMIHDIELCLNDNDLRERLGRNCRKYAEKEHDIRNIIKQYEKVFLGPADSLKI